MGKGVHVQQCTFNLTFSQMRIINKSHNMIINGCAVTISKSHWNGLSIKVTVGVCGCRSSQQQQQQQPAYPVYQVVSSPASVASHQNSQVPVVTTQQVTEAQWISFHNISSVCDKSGTYRVQVFLICSQDVLQCSSEQNSYHEFNISEDNHSKEC